MKKNQTKEQYTEWLNKIAEKNRNNPNHSEQAFIDILDYYNIYYTFEQPIIYNDKDKYYGYIFDFYIIIDGKKFDIEVDGISHTDEDAKLKDQKRDILAKDCNIKVIRLDSYFVLYLRNVFKKEFTKESFLKWIINECPINLKKDMSEYKEKEFNKKLYNIIDNIIEDNINIKDNINNLVNIIEEKENNIIKEKERKGNDDLDSMFHFDKKQGDDRRDNLILKKVFEEFKAKHQSEARQNKTSKDETSNNQEELPF
jgi:hypothetical protein